MMSRKFLVATLLGLAACGGGDRKTGTAADSLKRDLSLAPADTSAQLNDRPAADTSHPAPAAAAPAPAPAPAPKPQAPAPKPAAPKAPTQYTLATGTAMEATAVDTITSRHNKAGEVMVATVIDAIKDKSGRIVIPAGSIVTLKIVELKPAENKSSKDGTLQLEVVNISVRGAEVPVNARVDSVDHFLKGRGVTGGDVAKAGGGAAAGAVVGGLLGKAKGAVIGGIIGGAAGTAVAVQTADRDVVIPAGGLIRFVLTGDLVVPAK
jgi:hypothetical protein